MAVVVRYNPSGLTKEKYDAANQHLMEKSESDTMPADMLVHVCFGEEGSLRVSEIWTSEESWRESWQNFIKPGLDESGIEFASEPEVFQAQAVWGAGLTQSQS